MHVGVIIKKMREERGISARDLSLRSGMSSAYVNKVERGEIEPTVQVFSRICRNLGLSAIEVGVAVYATTGMDE